MSLMRSLTMDKTVFTMATLGEQSDEGVYWRRQTPEARLEALEFMRQVMYGYDPSTARLQRLLAVAPLKDPNDIANMP